MNGVDLKGRAIGYAVHADCDAPICEVKIDRGLSYACGDMHGAEDRHGNDETSCDGYFCLAHRASIEVPDAERNAAMVSVCSTCYARAPKCAVCGMRSYLLDQHQRCAECAEHER